MKSIITLLLLLFVLKNARSQSFLIDDNSNIISIATNGYAFNYGNFLPSYKVMAKGINYIIEEGERNNSVFVIDEMGYVYQKEVSKDIELSDKIKSYGGRFIIDTKGRISIILRNGFFISYENDELFKQEVFKSSGNYAIFTKSGKKTLMTINIDKGYYYQIDPTVLDEINLNLSKIKYFGSNFLIDQDGILFTVDKSGLIYSKKDQGNFNIKQAYGNYFIDSDDIINVVLDNGFLITPFIPEDFGTPKYFGSNYIINDQGILFSIRESVSEDEFKDWNKTLRSIIAPIPNTITTGIPVVISN